MSFGKRCDHGTLLADLCGECESQAGLGSVLPEAVPLDPVMNQPWWFTECEVIEKYRSARAKEDEPVRCVVRHVPTGMFLRYSKGPQQGHFWDVYGDDYHDKTLARLAIHQSGPPWKTAPPVDVAEMVAMEAKVNELRHKVTELTTTLADRDKTNEYLRGRLHEVHKASDVA